MISNLSSITKEMSQGTKWQVELFGGVKLSMQAKLYKRVYYPRFLLLILGLVVTYFLVLIFENPLL